MHAVAAKAVALKEAVAAGVPGVRAQVIANAQALAAGLAAEGMRPVSGGTDTHLALIDLRGVGVTGKEAEARCDAARITLNKNAIPYDPQPPMTASGIRVGTPGDHHPGHDRGRRQGDRGADRPRGARPGRQAAEVAARRGRLGPGAPGVRRGPERRAGRARVRAGLLHRRGGDVPAHPGGAGGGAGAGGRSPARATGTCTRSRPRGSAGWRCSSAWRSRCSSRTSCRRCAGRTTPARRPPRCSSPAGSSACSASSTTAGSSTR